MEDNHAREGRSFLEEMEIYLARNDLQKVLDLAQSRLSECPEDIDARVVICRVRLMQDRDDEALGMMAEIEKRLSALAGFYTSIGDLCVRKGLRVNAGVFFRKFPALRSSAFPAEIAPEEEGLAVRYETEKGGEDEEAGISAEFETPTLAALYLRQGHIDQAEEMLERIAARDPSNGRALLLLIDARRMRAQKEEKQKNAVIISTLEQWLAHMERGRFHA